MRKFVSFLTLIILMLIFQDQSFAQRTNQVRKVVIDAGHGGYDSGAKGRNSREKDITLAIALKTGKLIQQNCPGVKVIYTRESDVFVELYRRAQIANENKADLFISIHCNANPSPFAYGTETYVMGLHKSEANLDVARAENASILLENNYSTRYNGFDPNSPEAYIIFNLFQNAYLDKSLDFASRVESSFTENAKLSERGVKQAGFLVLYKTTMPGVLVETGFLSNAREEAFLISAEGQDRIAYSIYRAFDDFRKTSEGFISEANTVEDSLFNQHPAVIRLQQEKLEQALKGDTFGYRDNRKNEPVINKKTLIAIQKSKSTIQNKKETTAAKKEKPIQNVGKARQEMDTNSMENATKNKVAISKPDSKLSIPMSSNSGLKFRVQFLISTKEISLNGNDFKDIPHPKMYKQNGEFKYTAGDESTPNDADKIRKMLVEKGYRDAFVLPFFNDNRIPMTEALKMIKNKQ